MESREKAMRDFARLNVYIADSNVVKTQELADYTQNQLVSDIGGQLGLWVGISIITLTEVLELVIDIFHFISSSSYRKVPRNDTSATERSNHDNRNNHVNNGLSRQSALFSEPSFPMPLDGFDFKDTKL